MWRIRKFERVLFLPGFWLYAAIFRVSFSFRCRKCGRFLWDYAYSRVRICDNCSKEALSNPAKAYWDRGEDIVVTGVSSSGDYLYTPVTKRVGEGRILDIGCGQGHILSKLKAKKQELYGFDISLGLVKLAKHQVNNVNFLVANATCIPFKSDSFDFVTCSEVIEHIEDDIAVRECLRVLKPWGIALFTTPNKSGPFGGYQADHVHYFTLKSLADFVEATGFEVVGKYSIGLYIPIISHLLEVTALALRKNLPFSGPVRMNVPAFMGATLLLECRKPLAKGINPQPIPVVNK